VLSTCCVRMVASPGKSWSIAAATGHTSAVARFVVGGRARRILVNGFELDCARSSSD
jgi:hypothetical protein